MSQARSRKFFRVAVSIGVVLGLGLIFAAIDLVPDLSHVRITVLSGPQAERDYALVSRLAEQAQKRNGKVVNIATSGDGENLQRLIDADGKETRFALVLDGLDYPNPDKLELAARLPKPGQFSAEDEALLDDIIQQAQELRRWARKLALSLVAPMGSEMLYRNQENLIYQKLLVLRGFRNRLRALP